MRGDNGVCQFYAVEHVNEASRGNPRWARTDYGVLLYPEGLTWGERQARYLEVHALIDPTHDCWQETGHHEFLEYTDAEAMYDKLRELRPDRQFRLVAVGEARFTEVLA